MKLACLKENLLHAVSIADRITGRNLPLEVLQNILIYTEKGMVKIRATNLDLGVEIEVPAKISHEGSVALSGSVLQQFLTSIYDSHTITLTQEEGGLVVSSESNQATIHTKPTDDFPTLPQNKSPHTTTINSKELAKGLRTVSYSASHSTIKPEQASVYIYPDGEKLYFVATDSFRLAEKVISFKKHFSFEPILIPIKNITEILKVLESANEDVEMEVTETQLTLKLERTHLTSRLITGTFPDYQQIIPKEFESEVVALKQDILNTLKTTTPFLNKTTGQISFHIDPKTRKLTVSAKNGEVGETKADVGASISGEALLINFNHKYILDCFQVLETDSVALSFAGAAKPLIITSVSDTTFRYLVMPMNR